MSDNPEQPADEAPEAPAQDTEDQPKPEIDWKAKAREWERRAKDNKAAADRLAQMEEANKSESQRLAERAEKAERELASIQFASVRSEIALEKGLTAAQARRLIGDSREELEADADQLLADLGEANKPRSPRPDPNQGRSPGVGPKSTADSFAEFFRTKI